MPVCYPVHILFDYILAVFRFPKINVLCEVSVLQMLSWSKSTESVV